MAQIAQDPRALCVLTAVLHFQEAVDLGSSGLTLPEKFPPEERMAFEVDAISAEESLDAIKELWIQMASEEMNTKQMHCLVCRNLRPAMKVLPLLIHGIPGGQSGGLTLISADKAAYQSYGQEASFVAPTCEECSHLFSNALNLLLSQNQTHFRTSSAAYVFWAKGGTDSLVGENIFGANPDHVKKLFAALRTRGARVTQQNTTPFYAATLTASGNRVVLADWMETTLESVQYHLFRFKAFQTVTTVRGDLLWFPLRQLVGATGEKDEARDLPASSQGTKRAGEQARKKTTPAEAALVHFALTGGKLPLWLLSQTSSRICVQVAKGQEIQPSQVGLISLVLLSHDPKYHDWPATQSIKEKSMTELLADIEQPRDHPAYVCGQLLAVLEALQKLALGSVGAGIVKRYYVSASRVPASVFPRLLEGVHHHLTKIQAGENPAAKAGAFRLRQQLQELLYTLHTFDAQEPFPPRLDTTEQGLFHTGYFCWQRENDRARLAAAVKKQAHSSTPASDNAQKSETQPGSIAEDIVTFWSDEGTSGVEDKKAEEAEP
jgi:CRISPR-associated protein Csd1